jgi:acetyltransferase-like isoleucine patch superfamily enzyme
VRLAVPVVPDTYSPITPRRLWWVASQMSIAKSLYLSLRSGGFFLVSRGTKVRMERGAKVHLDPGAFFCIGFANRTAMSASLHLGLGAEVVVHGTALIQRGCRVFVHNGGRLSMGSRSYINDCSTLTCFEEVSIGSGCSISWNTNILDSNIHEIAIEGVPRPRASPVRIEDGVWVGAGATILPGVTVGAGAVIAAASVVTANVPPGALVAGNPAKVIRHNVTWKQ